MNKKLLILIWVTLVLTACETTPASQLRKMSDDMNKKCPFSFDSYTILDSTSYNKALNEFNYYYTLINVAPNNIEGTKMHLEQAIPAAVADNPEMNYFRKHQVTLNYRYYLNKGRRFLFQVTVEN